MQDAFLGARVVNPTNVEPAALSAVPNLATPTILTGTFSGSCTVVRSPTPSFAFLDRPRSMMTSLSVVGARPSTK